MHNGAWLVSYQGFEHLTPPHFRDH
uniref:Uncharacterized protein n=1 Tax=Anguilla anguilla TaxID=7936 RepID=A0A0E9RSZ3_ANGAN